MWVQISDNIYLLNTLIIYFHNLLECEHDFLTISYIPTKCMGENFHFIMQKKLFEPIICNIWRDY